MTGRVLELQNSLGDKDRLAVDISNMYDGWNQQRRVWLEEKKELRNYIFATDTTKTANAKLPWSNKTTIPKICQIRDNLHANYMAALFPNDSWMKWEGYGADDATKEKKETIQAYLANKTRESNFRTTVSKLIYDYIDYGNCFAEVVFIDEKITDPITGEIIPGYVGPKINRLSPGDVVFNPLAPSFEESPIVTRYIKTLGELEEELITRPELRYNKDVIRKSREIRNMIGAYSPPDVDKAVGIQIDGFGNLSEYYQSGYVEILEFEGNIHDMTSGKYLRNQLITVIDRSYVVRQETNPSWFGRTNKVHVGWRLRPDNLYAMGPLDNLVGMQYRMDHLENLKADVFDLIAFPPLKVKGNVEDFVWQPMEQIFLGDDGDVDMLHPDTTALQADTQIAILEQRMEDMAGAPKQAMGIRTPGEKTAFEVQALENAAGRIFQDKVANFEINLVEPLLNLMLEVGRRNMNAADVIRVLDDDLGVTAFLTITKEDITAKGKIRPVGARHFAARAQLVQNLVAFSNSAIGMDEQVRNHFSPLALAKLFEDALGLEKYALVKENARIFEQAQTQRIVNQVQEDLEVEAQTPTEATPEDMMGGGQPPMEG